MGYSAYKTFLWATKILTPLPDDAIHKIIKDNSPDESTTATFALELKSGFGYYTLFGVMMSTYITCRPDIDYTITTMSKFSIMPSALHQSNLKPITKYLYLTKDWGIKLKRTAKYPELDEATFRPEVTLDKKFYQLTSINPNWLLLMMLPMQMTPRNNALQSILRKLGFPSDSPTLIYEDNPSTIMIVNS